MNDKTVYVLIGCSGSGKSTFVKNNNVNNGVVYSWDDLRHRWYDRTNYANAYKMSTEDKDFVGKAQREYVQLLKTGINTIYVDNTNLTKKRRRFFIDEGRRHGYYVVAVLFITDRQTVINRQKTRGDKCVPEDAVIRQYNSLQLPSFGEFDDIIVR
jgi:predicted kinase